MADRFDLKTFLLSPEGRIGRSPCFSFFAIVAMYSMILSFSVGILGPSTIVVILTLILFTVTAWSRYCVTVKRLNDIGWPRPWAFIQFIPDITLVIANATGAASVNALGNILAFAVWVFVFMLIVTPGAKTETASTT